MAGEQALDDLSVNVTAGQAVAERGNDTVLQADAVEGNQHQSLVEGFRGVETGQHVGGREMMRGAGTAEVQQDFAIGLGGQVVVTEVNGPQAMAVIVDFDHVMPQRLPHHFQR